MIVTADPLGDFNATSQILRYSALAREVTVPRIPSTSSTILAGTLSRVPSGQTCPPPTHTDEAVVEMAFSEIARLNEEVEILKLRLNEEEDRRRQAEENWQKAEDKAEAIEIDVREECWNDMEGRLEEERRRWKAIWEEEADRNGEHLDRKIELLSKGIQIHEDPVDQASYTNQLETENEALRSKLEDRERELQCRSPTKKSVKKSTTKVNLNLASGRGPLGTAEFKLNEMSLTDAAEGGKSPPGIGKTAAKKRGVRKLTGRQWDLMDESELDAYGEY